MDDNSNNEAESAESTAADSNPIDTSDTETKNENSDQLSTATDQKNDEQPETNEQNKVAVEVTTKPGIDLKPNNIEPSEVDNSNIGKKPKSKAWLIVLIVVIAILIISGVSIGFLLATRNTKKEPSKTLSKSLSSLENSYKNKTVAFQFPVSPQGWNTEVFGKDGIYKYKYNTNSCQITFQQNKGVTQAISSGLTLDSEINSVIDGTSKLLTNNNLKVGSTGIHSFNTSDGKQVDLVTRQATYTGNDGVPYTIEVAGQWIGDYEFIIISACSTADWSQSNKIINDFLNKVSINIS
jgi:hypothetical protein